MNSVYSHPKSFKFKRKYQQMRQAFPDRLSFSYNYGAWNLDEYFHFYSIACQKFKMKEIFFKKLNNWVPKFFFHAL